VQKAGIDSNGKGDTEGKRIRKKKEKRAIAGSDSKKNFKERDGPGDQSAKTRKTRMGGSSGGGALEPPKDTKRKYFWGPREENTGTGNES